MSIQIKKLIFLMIFLTIKMTFLNFKVYSYVIYKKQARWKQLESGAAKTEEILKIPQQKGFYFFISKKLILTGKKALRRKPGLPQCFRRP